MSSEEEKITITNFQLLAKDIESYEGSFGPFLRLSGDKLNLYVLAYFYNNVKKVDDLEAYFLGKNNKDNMATFSIASKTPVKKPSRYNLVAFTIVPSEKQTAEMYEVQTNLNELEEPERKTIIIMPTT